MVEYVKYYWTTHFSPWNTPPSSASAQIVYCCGQSTSVGHHPSFGSSAPHSKISFRALSKKHAYVRTKLSVVAALPIPNLKADDFQHPLDKQNTRFLRAIPGLNELGKVLLGPVAEQLMLLENIATSIRASEKQLPSLHKLMVEAANILNIEAPDLYVRQNPVPNAYTLAIAGHKPFIVIHTSIVELLNPAELQAVIAHELGHLKCDHGIWLTFANIIALSAYSLPGLGGLIARNLEDQLLRWLRAAELTCDRAALLVAQDPDV